MQLCLKEVIFYQRSKINLIQFRFTDDASFLHSPNCRPDVGIAINAGKAALLRINYFKNINALISYILKIYIGFYFRNSPADLGPDKTPFGFLTQIVICPFGHPKH